MRVADVHGELADVVAGRIAGRTRADQIFVFDSTGTAIADLAAANAIFEIACADTAAPRFRLAA
jgi:ornithine cyclodeaminase/alanine dehydrogenase-like protein (mu-crystallin family)